MASPNSPKFRAPHQNKVDQTPQTEVYRREGELDCILSCVKGTKSGGCASGACFPQMKGCCMSVLTLRQGTMAFAAFEIVWNIFHLLAAFKPWAISFDVAMIYSLALTVGVLTSALLIVMSFLGLLGAQKRQPSLIKAFIWSHVIAMFIIFGVAILLTVSGNASESGWIFIYKILDVVFLWWMVRWSPCPRVWSTFYKLAELGMR